MDTEVPFGHRSGDRLRPQRAFEFVRAHQAAWPVRTLCRVLGVSPSGYYAYLQREPSARARADETLTERVEAIHKASRETCGAPRIYAELRAEGRRVGRNRVARLMRAAGICGVDRRKGVPLTTVREEGRRPAPDLVGRDFEVTGPDRRWVADITYVPT